MRHVAAYILAVIGGNASPDEAALKKILNSVGIEPVDAHLKIVIDQLAGKDLFALIAEGSSLLAGMPAGGGEGGAAAAVEAAPVEEAPKEEAKKPEPESDSEDSDMGMGLFD